MNQTLVMKEETFWKVIDGYHSVRGKGNELELLIAALEKLDRDELLAFLYRYVDMHHRAKCRTLWGVSIILNQDPCDEECFDYFRSYLILQGQGVYQTALTSPDDLADNTTFRPADGMSFQDRNIKGALFAAYFKISETSIFADATRYTDEQFIDDLEFGNWGSFSGEEMRKELPKLCEVFDAKLLAPEVSEASNPYEVPEAQVPEIGMLRTGDKLVHRTFGLGRVQHIFMFPGNLIRAHVLFKDWPRELSFEDPLNYVPVRHA